MKNNENFLMILNSVQTVVNATPGLGSGVTTTVSIGIMYAHVECHAYEV